ncbi:MAG TPA: putative toxin-antitoxin system toxin component, PIN family, partial [Chloroflexi bacterium]|nr:putative toxin-antitoxin system toxin component, PIN family [Chloroflexota bacterium]
PGGCPAQIISAWLDERFEVVISPPILEELEDVLSRPRLRTKYEISEKQVQRFLSLIVEGGIPVSVTGRLALCRDLRDDMLLETAEIGGAAYVISRDEDITRDPELAARLKERGIEPITVARFLALLESLD